MVFLGEISLGELHRLKLRRLITCGIVIATIVFWNPTRLPRTKIRENRGESLVALQEGSHGIVAVVEQPGSRRMKLDNFYVLGGTASTGDERMQAHIPLLLHPAPKQVAFLGLDWNHYRSGFVFTLSSASRHSRLSGSGERGEELLCR
jgi:hypothetical protein